MEGLAQRLERLDAPLGAFAEALDGKGDQHLDHRQAADCAVERGRDLDRTGDHCPASAAIGEFQISVTRMIAAPCAAAPLANSSTSR